MIKQQFNALLTKEMDRKDFLKYSGGVLLAAVGVTGMVRLLLGQGGIAIPGVTAHSDSKPTIGTQLQQHMGYGGSAYGR